VSFLYSLGVRRVFGTSLSPTHDVTYANDDVTYANDDVTYANDDVTYAYDAGMEASAELARREAAIEFVHRFKTHQNTLASSQGSLTAVGSGRVGEGEGEGGKGALPVLASECPGFVLFIEKTHGQTLLPHLSQVSTPSPYALRPAPYALPYALPCALHPCTLRIPP